MRPGRDGGETGTVETCAASDLTRSTPRLSAEHTFVAGRILAAFSSTVACSSATHVKFYVNRGKPRYLRLDARVSQRGENREAPCRKRLKGTECFGNKGVRGNPAKDRKSDTHIAELTDFTCPP